MLAEPNTGRWARSGSYTPPRSMAKWKGAGVGPTPTYSYSACVVELSADRETGIIRVDKVWIAHDVGRSINPVLVIGQVEGSVYMGLGEAPMEEPVFRNGLHEVPSCSNTRARRPWRCRPSSRSSSRRSTPRARTARRSPRRARCCPVTPAVANALLDALGVHIDEVPVAPEKVMQRSSSAPALRGCRPFTYPPTVVVPPLEAAEPARVPEVDPAVRP